MKIPYENFSHLLTNSIIIQTISIKAFEAIDSTDLSTIF